MTPGSTEIGRESDRRAIPKEKLERMRDLAHAMLAGLAELTHARPSKMAGVVDFDRWDSRAKGSRSKTGKPLSLKIQVQQFEISLIKLALKGANGNRRLAAKLLEVNLSTLNEKLRRYGIPFERYKDKSGSSKG